jgi:anti-anti-sigma regulatory factor
MRSGGTTIEVNADAAGPRVAVRGALDLFAVPLLRRALDALDRDAGTELLVDLSEATVEDSAIVGLFAAAVTGLAGDAGPVVVCGADPRYEEMFRLFGLDPVDDTEPEAGTSTGGPSPATLRALRHSAHRRVS